MAAIPERLLFASLVLAACGRSDGMRLPVVADAEDASSLLAEWPVCTIHARGAVEIDGGVIAASEVKEETLLEWLGSLARAMPTEPLNEEFPDGPRIPGRPLVLRVDERAPYASVRAVLNAGNHFEVKLWDYRVLVRREADDVPGVLAFEQLRDVGTHVVFPWEPAVDEVRIALGTGGELRLYRTRPKRDLDDRSSRRFVGAGDEELRAHFERLASHGTNAFWFLRAPDAASWQEVVAALAPLVAAGHRRVAALVD